MTDSDLARQVEELREAIRARDDFLAIAAHELRNPMHALLLSISATHKAAQHLGDPVLVDRLERVMLTVKRYIQRANLLLDVSRINAGQFRLKIEDADFARIVRDVVTSYRAEAEFNDVLIRCELPETLKGRWDPVAVEQIVANLISNAVKYGAGAPVDVSLVQYGSDALELTVTDHGIGISEDDQERIFGRFEQAIAGPNRSGFGLGLWLIRCFVEAHGGTISVESVLEQGSTFRVQVPTRAIASDEQLPCR